MPSRPNILLVLTDQQTREAVGYRNAHLDTPAIDDIADSGVSFSRAYCQNPVCTPSRSSMLTGRASHETGVTANQEALPEEYHPQTLGVLLDEAGYDCAYAGKWHVKGLDVEDAGFEHLCDFNDTGLAAECEDFLARDREDPFFLVASFDNPHNICEWARDQNLPWGNVPEPELSECPTLPANFYPPPFEPGDIRHEIRQRRRTMGAMADADPERWRRYRHAYYRLVEKVDDELGRLRSALAEHADPDDTVTIFTSDHGDGNGAHQINQKWWLYEEIVGVPLIVDDPTEGARPAQEHLTSNGLDLLPTIADYAGVVPPEDLRGRSLRPIVSGADPNWRDSLVLETYDPLKGRAVVGERYKYVVYSRGENREQLFDREADPGEMVDLTADDRHADVLGEYRERLLEYCCDTRDRFASHNVRSGHPSIPGYEHDELERRFGAES
jgi:arylsulfatase A-like enzyme